MKYSLIVDEIYPVVIIRKDDDGFFATNVPDELVSRFVAAELQWRIVQNELLDFIGRSDDKWGLDPNEMLS